MGHEAIRPQSAVLKNEWTCAATPPHIRILICTRTTLPNSLNTSHNLSFRAKCLDALLQGWQFYRTFIGLPTSVVLLRIYLVARTEFRDVERGDVPAFADKDVDLKVSHLLPRVQVHHVAVLAQSPHQQLLICQVERRFLPRLDVHRHREPVWVPGAVSFTSGCIGVWVVND